MKVINNQNVYSRVIFPVFLFIIGFSYMIFFTGSVPFFFDDHEFHEKYIDRTYFDYFKEMIQLNYGSFSDSSRPAYGLFIKTLFPLFGFDYFLYRLVKAFIFSLFLLSLYSLLNYLFHNRIISFLSSLSIMTIFPTYIQVFGYNGPHIFAELFKICAILFFLRDFSYDKTSWKIQASVFLFSFLALRFYAPAYSIIAILFLFTLFSKPKKLIQYLLLFFIIAAIQFPISFTFSMITENPSTPYTPKGVNIYHIFTNNFVETITTPIPSYDALYYKSFYNILTFFGFWLLITMLLLLFLHKFNFLHLQLFTSEQETRITNSKEIIILSIIWMISELPSYIYLPESAIRYSFTFFIPFTILITFVILYTLSFISYKYRNILVIFIIAMLFGAMLTNVSYVYAFRAGWGSSFIAFDKGMDYFAEKQLDIGKIGVLYASSSVADEYYPINKSSPTYELDLAIKYIKSSDSQDFSEQRLQEYAKNYTSFYVIQRTTSFSMSKIPEMPLNTYSSLKQVATINGVDNSILFDRWNIWMTSFLEIPYHPNELQIYQYVSEKRE